MDNESVTSQDQDAASRRRSGRVVKAPEKYEPELSQSAKRKRGAGNDDGLDDGIDSEEESSEEEDDSDEEHPAPRSRKPAQRKKKPSTKKPKINGGHTARIPSRPKKTVRIEAGEKGTGLFGTWLHIADLERWHILIEHSGRLWLWRLVSVSRTAMAREIQGRRCHRHGGSRQLYFTMRWLRPGCHRRRYPRSREYPQQTG